MNETRLTEDELVSVLSHSSLPTILVEGKDDMSVYRWIEDDLELDADILVCGCRNTLFNVYKRKDEFKNIKSIFVADSDKYVHSTIPKEYNGILFTKGYSIENDLYQGRQIESLLSKGENKSFQIALANFIRYYGCQLEKLMNGEDVELSQNPHQILDTDNNYLLREDQVDGGYHEPAEEIVTKLAENYDLLLRGHSLISLLLLFLSAKKRGSNKYSAKSICECCYKLKRSQAMKELLEKLRKELKAST